MSGPEPAPAPAGPVTSEQFLEMLAHQREAMSAQQQTLNELMKHMIAQQAAQTPLGPRGNNDKLIGKYFRCPQFTGKAETWGDFAFRFKRAAKIQSPKVFDMLEAASCSEAELADNHPLIDAENAAESATLYDLLCQHVEGEGLMVLKANVKCEGLHCWNMLYNRYNPASFSRGLQLLTNIVNPGKIKEYKDVESGIVLWEEKVALLEKQFDEKLQPKLKTAILLNAMPSGVQEHVYQHMQNAAAKTEKEKEERFADAKDLIKRFATRKAESNGPTPMDIVNAQEENWRLV